MLWQTLQLGPYQPIELDLGDGDEAAMRALATELDGAGQAVEVEWLLDRLTEYRRHRGAVSGYVCRDRLDVPALLVAGDLPEPYVEEWRSRLSQDSIVARLAGSHFELLRPPLVAEVAELLVARIEGRPAAASVLRT
jgi:thioesterase domain-containing protein